MIHPELETHIQRLDNLREQDTDLLATIPPEALNWHLIAGQAEYATNSPAPLATHTAGPGHCWIAEVTETSKRITAFRETLTRLLEENVK